jgi:hypothetical protein
MTPSHRHLLSRVGVLSAATLALDLLASLAVFFLERRAPGTGIHTFGDALFWTSTQLTTVSSPLPNPASAPARILDVALQAYAVAVVAILAGSFGAFFHGRSMEHREGAAAQAPARDREMAPASGSAARSSETAPDATSTTNRPLSGARA